MAAALLRSDSISSPSARIAVAAGNGYHQRVESGVVESPSGPGPHYGFYYGSDPNGGKLYVGNRPIYF